MVVVVLPDHHILRQACKAGSRGVACLLSMTAAETKIQIADLCLKHQVERLQMFGSAARGETDQASDIDFIVEFKEMIPAEYARHFFGLIHDLEDRLQSPVDLLTWESVRRPVLRQSIEQDAVLLYEA